MALRGEWYKEDCGPILGFMEEDDRPVALIPVSPDTYILDPVCIAQKGRQRIGCSDKRMGLFSLGPSVLKKLAVRPSVFWLSELLETGLINHCFNGYPGRAFEYGNSPGHRYSL